VLHLTPTPQPIDAFVEAGMELDGEPYMHSYWRVSRGEAVHTHRETRPDGSVRITIDDANGFSWDTIQLDVSHAQDGSIKAEAVVFWTRDFGEPFEGTVAKLTGRTTLSSADWSDTHPLVVDFDIRGEGLDEAVRENGRVAVPYEEGRIGPSPR
jgi:hypothetical protein